MGMPKAPAPPPVPMPPPAAHPPTLGSAEIAQAGLVEKQRAQKAEGLGLNNTIKTSAQGAPLPETAKTYLG